MRVPRLKAISVGDVSPWGKQFLADLEEADVLQLAYESNVLKFVNSNASQTGSQIIFMENFPESRNWMLSLVQSKRPFYLVWFGRTFTKEDFKFALDNRVYAVFENAKLSDKEVVGQIVKLAVNQDSRGRFEQLVRSLKSILVQAEMEESPKEHINEMKLAVSKLEQCTLLNEFNHQSETGGETDEKLPFYKAQELGDALLTVQDLERSGILWIRGNQTLQEGKIEFLHGKIIGATAGEVRGLKAIYRMFLWDEQRFLFSRKKPDDCVPEENIDINLKSIVREGHDHRGRFQRIRKELPPGEIVLSLEPTSLHPDTGLTPPDFATLATVLEFGRVAEILDYSSLPDIQIYESLIRLKKDNFIRVTGFPRAK
jgi:hypothetical protein